MSPPAGGPAAAPPDPAAAPPATLRAACVLLGLEGGALLVLGVLTALGPLSRRTENVAAAEIEAGLAVLTGLLLGFLARALLRRVRAARTPAVLLNLLALPVGVGLLQGHVPAVGVPMLLVALAVLGLLAAAPSRAAFAPTD